MDQVKLDQQSSYHCHSHCHYYLNPELCARAAVVCGQALTRSTAAPSSPA